MEYSGNKNIFHIFKVMIKTVWFPAAPNSNDSKAHVKKQRL